MAKVDDLIFKEQHLIHEELTFLTLLENEIIRRAHFHNVDLNSYQFQKLLYLCYAHVITAGYEVTVKFHCWKNGPVNEYLFEKYDKKKFKKVTAELFPTSLCLPYYVIKTIDEVCNVYLVYENCELRALLEQKNSAWAKALSNALINKNDIIKDVQNNLY